MKIAIIGLRICRGDLYPASPDSLLGRNSRCNLPEIAGKPIETVHPHLKGFTDLVFENPGAGEIDADVAFLAVPHTAAMTYARPLLDNASGSLTFRLITVSERHF